MLNYQIILGIIGPLLTSIGFIVYIAAILGKKIKPHSFTWFVWGLLQGVIYFADVAKGAGAGEWIVAFGSTMCFVVFAMSLFRGEKRIVKLDVASLSLALLGIILWIITSNPLLAVVLATTVDVLGFVPTFRKAYHRPKEEAVMNFALGSIAFTISIFALQSVNLVTVMFPATVGVIDAVFVIMVLARRKALAGK